MAERCFYPEGQGQSNISLAHPFLFIDQSDRKKCMQAHALHMHWTPFSKQDRRFL